jgi:hypothetical protein
MNVKRFFAHDTDQHPYAPVFQRWYVVALIMLFAITHAPMNFFSSWYDRLIMAGASAGYLSQGLQSYLTTGKEGIMSEILIPVRTWLFLLALLTVLYPLFVDIRSHLVRNQNIYRSSSTYTYVLLPFAALCILIIPSQLGLGGNIYAAMSIDPFAFKDTQMWFYQRVLMPSLAYYLQLKGPLLYFMFSLFVTVFLLFLVHLFFHLQGKTLSRLELISVGTSSFLMTQLQSPGYTEQMAYVLLMILFLVPTGTAGRLSIVALSLIAHEISVVPMLFVAVMFFTRKEQMLTVAVVAFYSLFWLLSFGGDVSTLLSVRNVGGMSGLAWAVNHPLRLLSGILISYKLLWIVLIIGIVKYRENRMLIAGFTLIAVAFTFMGVDTSRLMGFALVGLLFSLLYVREHLSANAVRYQYLLIANIILPSFYIGTNIGVALINGVYDLGGGMGIVVFNGVYQVMYLGVMLQ